jgi:hypothetical protein
MTGIQHSTSEKVSPLLADGLYAADVDGELLVLDSDSRQVVRVCCGNASLDEIVAALDCHGLISTTDPAVMSRRRVMQGAVAAGVVGVSIIALPTAAMAASVILDAPIGVTATASGENQVTVSWNPVTGATSYQVFFKLFSDSTYSGFGGPVTASSVAVTGLVNLSTYNFYVVAIVGAVNSPPSAVVSAIPPVPPGINWVIRTSAVDNAWVGVAYGNGLFVAVSETGSSNRVMTSPNGITWTARASAADNNWRAVTYGLQNGDPTKPLFVAVSDNGSGNRVMTSPDGINWTTRTSVNNNAWVGVTYGGGLFVAVSNTGSGTVVMTSPDGITWTGRTAAVGNAWQSVTYGLQNGDPTKPLFVAVANSGTGNRVMTSLDGITWTSRTSAADNFWYDIAFGNGVFVAVGFTGSNRVMTSPDGITWTARNAAVANEWLSVAFGDGLFVAVSGNSGTGNRVMTSPDGITWTSRTSAADNIWRSTIFGDGRFVAVAVSGTNNRVMTSP